MTASGTPGLFTATPEYVAQCGRQVEGIQAQCTTVSRQAFTEISPLVNGRWAGAAAMKARQIVLTLESDMNALLAALGEFSSAITQTATSVDSQEQNATVAVGQVGGGLDLGINRSV